MQTKLYVVLQTVVECLDRTMGGYLAVSLLCLYLITQSACTLSKDDQSACRLPMQTGPCKAAFPRFFYDTGDGTCKLFLYGGCEGNENNFLSKADCERLCLAGTTPGGRVTSPPLTTPSSISPSSADRVCQLPAESGLCLGYFPYYFFNAQVGECQEFIYGGCGGNENRFATKQECENQCRSSYVARTLPPSTDVCSLPKAAGMCDAYFPAFFYNSATGECEFFVYGGCQGNANRFDTLAACEQRCKETKTTTETTITNANRCTLPAAPGVCKAYVPSFYFDFQTGQCKSFVYGGCGGNANRFATIEQCQKTCPGGKKKQRISAICLQPKLVGPCRAAFPRFYYNQSSGQCESFVYGGCSGNQNNFRSYDDCVRRCNQ